jgi:hypothetical protein
LETTHNSSILQNSRVYNPGWNGYGLSIGLETRESSLSMGRHWPKAGDQ